MQYKFNKIGSQTRRTDFVCDKNKHNISEIYLSKAYGKNIECCRIEYIDNQPERLSEKTSKDDAIV
jgi:hypothetical protein